MTDDIPSPDRRTVLKGLGAGAAATVATGSASAYEKPSLADAFDMGGGPQEALVVFDRQASFDHLDEFDATSWTFESLPIAFGRFDPSQLRRLAAIDAVRGIYPNAKLEYDNDDARELTNSAKVHAGEGVEVPYTGESVHAAVIDTGVDSDHPDLAGNLQANWQWVGAPDLTEPITWENVAPAGADTDENGHGTHCSGSVAGAGTASDGQFAGQAPGADLSVYSIGATLLLVYVVSAWDHLVTRKRNGETDIQVVSNSYSPATDGRDFDPFEPVNVATWNAFNEGIVACFSAGNDGPGESNLSQYGEAPYTLVSPATHDVTDAPNTGYDEADRTVADFSGRGRRTDKDYAKKNFEGPNNHHRQPALENIRQLYDYTQPDPGRPYGVYRPDAGTPGNLVMSTMSPADALQGYGALSGVSEVDAEPYYGQISGTSMSTPTLAGCVATIIDAYQQHHDDAADPVDVMNTIQATAKNYHPVGSDVSDKRGSPYTRVNIGPGFIDVQAACQRAEDGNWADFTEAEENLIAAQGVN